MMRQPAMKLLALAALVAASCVAIVWFTPLDHNIFLAASRSKHDRLARTPPPRIVLVGGSNVSFGVDSRLLQERTGYAVVNMALHIGLGLRFMLNEIRDELRPGDFVVIIPEYSLLLDGSQVLLELDLFYPRAFAYMDWRNFSIVAAKFPITLQRRFKSFLKLFLLNRKRKALKGYGKDDFNEFGDVIGHLGRKPFKNLGHLEIPSGLAQWREGEQALVFLNRLQEQLSSRGVRFFFSFPPCPASQYPKNGAGEEFYDWVKKRLAFPVVGHPRETVFPDEYFYDTYYHLLARGRQERTEKLARQLAPYLPPTRPPGL